MKSTFASRYPKGATCTWSVLRRRTSGVQIFSSAIGIFLGTVARTTPQLGLLFTLIFLPMNMLSDSNTPLESMPPWLATTVQISPSAHFVSFAQSILYRSAGFDVVWPRFLFVAIVGGLFFLLAILRFRSTAAQATWGTHAFYRLAAALDANQRPDPMEGLTGPIGTSAKVNG